MRVHKIVAFSVLILLVAVLFAGAVTIPAAAQTTPSPAIILHNPWVQKSNVYEGVIHFHSTRSDGSSSPEVMSQAYGNEGFNFTVLTDHNTVTTDYTPANDILAIPGEEVSTCEQSCSATSHRVHIGAIGTDQIVDVGQTQGVINNILNQGGLAVLNHPVGGSHAFSSATLNALTNYSFFETQVYGISQAFVAYDNLLTEGKIVWQLRDDDAHNIQGVNNSATMVNANSLDRTEIMANLKAGNFYTATGYRSTSSREMARISSIVANDRTITITVPQQSTITWIKTGGVVARTTANVMSDSYTARGDEGYVRIEVSLSSNPNVKAWSQPVFVTQSPTVTAVDPGDNAANVPISKTVTVTFNQAVQQGANYANIMLKQGTVRVNAITTLSGDQLTISPNALLAYNTAYTVFIPKDGVKIGTQTMTSDFTSTFTTVAAPVVVPKESALTIATTTTTPTTNVAFTLSGILTSGTTTLANQPVHLERRTGTTGAWADVANTYKYTDGSGVIRLSQTVSTAGIYQYRWHYNGTATYQQAHSAAVTETVKKPATTTITISTSKTTPTTNVPVTLSGTLKSGTTNLTSKPVHLERRTGTTGAWANVANTFKYTNALGKVTVSQKISTRGIYQYRWHFNGTTTYLPAYSAAVTETVKKPTTMAIRTSSTAPKLNVAFTVAGTLKSGTTGLKGLSVHLERKIGTGAWTTVAGTTKITGTGGAVSVSQKVTSHHTYHYQWHFMGTATYKPCYSPVKTFTV